MSLSPTDAVPVLQGALAVVGGLAVILWRIPGECVCDQCAFHANERRMAKARQVELNHDYAHKGRGFRDGDVDLYNCTDPACKRNVETRGTL